MALVVEKQPVLDLLDIKTPALSATSDMPVIETKPDSVAPKTEEKKVAEATLEPTAPEDKAAPAAEVKPEEPAPSETPDDTAAEPEPKKAKGVQKRIDELTRQREDERRRAEAAEARLDRALSALEKGVTKELQPTGELKEPQKPVLDPSNPEAYNTAFEQYITERANYVAEVKVREKLAEEDKKRKDQELADQQKQVQQSYLQRVQKATEKYPDYHEVAESPEVQVSIPMASAIAHSEEGPEIAYYLGKNPAEAERISKLVPQLQLVELGKIVAKITTPAPSPKPVSAAPSPGKPIKAGSEATISPEEESMEQYAARRKKELAQQYRPGVRH